MNIKPFEKKVWLSSPTMHGEELKYVTEEYDKNWITTAGENVNECERLCAEYVGSKYAVALSCGTAALHMAVKLAGEKLYGQAKPNEGTLRGHKVFCSDMTFDATVNPVAYEDGEAVFIDTEYDTWNMCPIALEKAFEMYPDRIRGSYALCVMYKDYPGESYAARKDSPMIIGIADGETYVASDVPAILKYTRNVYYIGNLEIAKLEKGKVTFFNIDCEEITKPLTEIKWDAESAEKGGYEHFMLKEIHEQPKVIKDTINSVVTNDVVHFDSVKLTGEEISNIQQVYIVACGSAYHVGVAAQYVFEELTSIQVRVELASEFRYRKMKLNKNSLVIVISQSGEIADTLAALREAKNQGIKTLAIVNVVGSSIAREADNVFYTLAGPEISVATTKAYSTQLIAGYLLALQLI